MGRASKMQKKASEPREGTGSRKGIGVKKQESLPVTLTFLLHEVILLCAPLSL